VPKRSAGILMYKHADGGLRVLLVHPGGPFWAKKDVGAWSIPKGEYDEGEDALVCAKREFVEELGRMPEGEFRALGEVVQRGGKRVIAWAIEGDLDVNVIVSNTFEMEWPPKSGRRRSFPEVDRAAWFTVEEAQTKILAAQRDFIARLVKARQ
jgi:predicted NUDIX family NTP pyrophosphohydrolase